MITREEPYSEYRDDLEKITTSASQGILPLGLKRIDNVLCVDFIQKCICVNPAERLSVEQLLEHPFLQPNEENDEKEVTIRKFSFSPIFLLQIFIFSSNLMFYLVPLSSKLSDHRNSIEKNPEMTSIEKPQSLDSLAKDQSSLIINPSPIEQTQFVEPTIKQQQQQQVSKDSDPSNQLFSSISPADRPPRHPSPALTNSQNEDNAISRATPYLFPRDNIPTDLNTFQIESGLTLSSTPISSLPSTPSQQQQQQHHRISDTYNSEKNNTNNNNNNININNNNNTNNNNNINNIKNNNVSFKKIFLLFFVFINY